VVLRVSCNVTAGVPAAPRSRFHSRQSSRLSIGRRLGMQQPAIARLEAGGHQPSLATLARLAAGLGIEFHIDITPETFELRETA
jgi:transcriptional regulator with XRE-family HTH domain